MDVNRLRFGEMVAAAGAAVLFLVMFLDWYGPEGGPGGASAWQSFTFIDLFLFFLVIIPAIALAVLTVTQRTVALPLSLSVLVTALGALGSLLILYRLVNEPGFEVGIPDSVIGIKIAAYLGFLSALTIAFGGFMSMRNEGTSFGAAAAGVQAPMRPAPPPGPGAPSPQPTGMPPVGYAPGTPAAPPQGAPPGPPPGAPPGPAPGAPPPGAPPGPAPGAPPPGAPPGPPPGAPPGSTQVAPQPGAPPQSGGMGSGDPLQERPPGQ